MDTVYFLMALLPLLSFYSRYNGAKSAKILYIYCNFSHFLPPSEDGVKNRGKVYGKESWSDQIKLRLFLMQGRKIRVTRENFLEVE